MGKQSAMTDRAWRPSTYHNALYQRLFRTPVRYDTMRE